MKGNITMEDRMEKNRTKQNQIKAIFIMMEF
jgi:hypothetical protein